MCRFAAAMALFAALGCAEDKEVKVKMRDLPEAVRKTVQERIKGASLRGLSKEVEDGKTYYEAELRVGGHGKDVTIDTAGTVAMVEEEVLLASLPAAAREALQKSIAGGKLLKLEAISTGDAIKAYEAHVRKGLKTSEIKVTPEGKPVEKYNRMRLLLEDERLSAPQGPDVPLRGNPQLLRRLIANLLDNAIRYTPPGGEVDKSQSRAEDGFGLGGPVEPRPAHLHHSERAL